MNYCQVFVVISALVSSFYYVQAEKNLALNKTAIQSSTADGHTASRAVDGNLSQALYSCGHTAYKQRQTVAWWNVDLQNTSEITYIKIYVRNGTNRRLNGFELYIGTDNTWTGTQPCYKDTEEGNPPIILRVNCTGLARYITIVQRTFDELDKDYGPILELCEVQVFGCVLNTFGPNCTSDCHCKKKGCNLKNGICKEAGCEAGWQGDSCNKKCDANKFGEGCNSTCHCLTGSCNHISGKCDPPICKPGYRTETCSERCTNNTFGLNCSSTCYCNKGSCNHEDGKCVIPGCKAGWKEDSCSIPCEINKFGPGCISACNCLNGTCSRTSGICDIPGCKDGYKGATCSNHCDKDYFGSKCISRCYCKTESCNHITGECDISGCQDGYKGEKCMEKCENGTFGSNCENKCNCLNGTCNHEHGLCATPECQDGWTGSSCSEKQEKGGLSSGSGSVGIAVGVVVAVIVIAVVVVVGIIYRRRKRTLEGKQEPNLDDIGKIGLDPLDEQGVISEKDAPVNITGARNSATKQQSEREDIYVNVIDSKSPTKMSIKELRNKLSMNNVEEELEKEYKDITYGPVLPCTVGEKEENKDKNRFRAIFPYDHSRVVLKTLPGIPNSDYINANYIDGIAKQSMYVAAQGPKTSTVDDFWRMIWQIKSNKIVMLTNLEEKGKVKCFRYWPKVCNNQEHGDFKIYVDSEVDSLYFTTRQLKVTHQKTGEIRKVYHFHFTTWPDHGTPDPTQLVLFHRNYMQTKSDQSGPPVIHCSAGVGRTGTFIALDALYRHGKSTKEVDVCEYVKIMRKNRMNMVQTKEQYVIVYEALLQAFQFQETSLSKDDFVQSLQQDRNRIMNEFKKLTKNIQKYDKISYKGGMEKINQPKNRVQNILPVEKFRPYLISHDSSRTNYINAVIIPSYKDHVGCLVTQLPLTGTVIDFWCMVYDHESSTVVTLDCFSEKVNWIPTDENEMKLGKFSLRRTSEPVAVGDTRETELSLSYEDKGKSVKVFEVMNWTYGNFSPPSENGLLNFIELVEHWKSENTSGPITVVCMDGAKCCGLFCALYNVLQKLRYEDHVDIYQTVKQIQARRPEFVSSIEQYQFLYNVVKEHIEKANVYVN